MKKNDPPIHAMAAVTWSQRNSAEPHSQPKLASAPINPPPPGDTFAPGRITIKAAARFGEGVECRDQLVAQRRAVGRPAPERAEATAPLDFVAGREHIA